MTLTQSAVATALIHHVHVVLTAFSCFQHANEDVEKMILGNKNDMDEKRVVSKERGEAVSVQLTNCV
jgi:Ras family.